MSVATKSTEVGVAPEKIFDIIADFDSYPEFLSHLGMVAVKTESGAGDRKVVTQSVKKMGKVVSYTLDYTFDRPRKISWTFVKGQMMKDNRGSWTFEELSEGHTKITYSAEVKFGMLVPGSLVSMMISKELPQLLDAFKKRAEKG
ncbi:MAG TPA: SRPBCC family protein [Myxococcota bacterium]|nr:SRPBCC family protein [Myxococcota bacterium]